jgi:hypothetical protein
MVMYSWSGSCTAVMYSWSGSCTAMMYNWFSGDVYLVRILHIGDVEVVRDITSDDLRWVGLDMYKGVMFMYRVMNRVMVQWWCTVVCSHALSCVLLEHGAMLWLL